VVSEGLIDRVGQLIVQMHRSLSGIAFESGKHMVVVSLSGR